METTVETIKAMMADPMQSGSIPERATECLTFLLKLTDQLGKALGEIYKFVQSPDEPDFGDMSTSEMVEFADTVRAMAGSGLFYLHYPKKAAEFDVIFSDEKGD